MKIIIISSNLKSTGAYILNYLLKNTTNLDISVIYAPKTIINKKNYFLRKARKVIKIGFSGALIGVYIRKWYNLNKQLSLNLKSLDKLCSENGLNFYIADRLNSTNTIKYIKTLKPDLGVSIGNGYISSNVFSTPKHGMINIHHEELPLYQGAQSVIWQLYNNSLKTAYTIHKINKQIDGGHILMQENISIKFEKTLEKTVSETYFLLWKASAKGLEKLIYNFTFFDQNSKKQLNGNTYTTPSLMEFIKILNNHKKLYNITLEK